MRDGAGVLFCSGAVLIYMGMHSGCIPLSGAPQLMMGFGMHQRSKNWYRGALLAGLVVPLLAATA